MMLFAALLLSALPPRHTPPVIVIRPPAGLTEAERRYPVGPLPADWPSVRTGAAIVGPDWSDYHIYPVAAAWRGQQGRVRIALRVGTDGRPRACRVAEGSGYVELDDGTCDLAMTMRFAPAAEPATERLFAVRINWEMTDPIALAPRRAVARLDLDDGRVTSCSLEAGSDIPPGWTRNLCRTFTDQPGYFLGSALTLAHRAYVVTQLRPAGVRRPAPSPPPGRLVATSRTAFDLAPNGDFVRCRAREAGGFGIAVSPYWGACGPGLVPLTFDPPRRRRSPRGGEVEIKVYVER